MRRHLLPATFLFAAAVDAQQWTALDGPRYMDRAAAFDTHRLRLVMFSLDGETWEYDGDRLLHRPLLNGAVAPPPRSRAQMAYDSQRKHVLMFGGLGSGTAGTLADTWTFDGARWTQLVAQPSPPRRVDGGITFDSVRARVVMYGGQSLLPGQHSDTWEHDGALWTQRAPATVPTPNAPVMTFDSGRGVVVMVTHPGMLGQTVSTWEWDGTNWRLPTMASASPTVSGNEALAYDPVRQRTVMTGGAFDGDRIWEWDGAVWTHRATLQAPLRLNAASWFDPVAGKVVVAGGTDVTIVGTTVMQGSGRTDAYEWDGVALSLRRADHRPPSRFDAVWVADSIRQQMLMFGGRRGQALVAETWSWNGTAWTMSSPANQPSPRFYAAATFDWLRDEVLLFGGFALGQALGDTWVWNGTDWAQRVSVLAPAARSNAGLCFDLLRGVVVLFGGTAGALTAGNLRNDTWEWNGAAWTQRLTTVQPPPRDAPAMTFDVARGRVVLFGGRTGPTANDHLGDTWEWNGTQWVAIQPAAVPPALGTPTLHFDFVRGRSVLFGTRTLGQPGQLSHELWGYNGATWTSIATSTSGTLTGPSVLDVARDRLVVTNGALLSEWSLRPSSVGEYGSGCGSPAPVLLARARPRLGEPAFGVELGVGAGQPVGFAFAEAQANVPIGNGCTLLFGQPAVSVFGVAGGNGVASLSFAIPDDGSLHGYVLFAQAGVLDPASPGGFRLTQGLRLAFGD